MSETVLGIWITILVGVEVSPGHLDVFLDGDFYPWRTVQLTLISQHKTSVAFHSTMSLKCELLLQRRTG